MHHHDSIQRHPHQVRSSFRLPVCRGWLSFRSCDPTQKPQCTNKKTGWWWWWWGGLIKSSECVLTSHCALLDQHLLAGALGGRGVESRASRQGAGETVSRHVFTVRLSDDPKGARVGVRYVGDGVPVQRCLVGDGTYLLDGQLGAGLGLGWERRLEGLVVAEGDVGAGAQASGGLLGGRGRVRRRRLRDVLVQP